MIPTTIAGSLPKPGWLAEPEKLWAGWRLEGGALVAGQERAAREWIAFQEGAGIDIVSDGEQFRRHFVHGFLEEIDGIDWQKMTTMGIRNDRYDAEVPTVTASGRRRASCSASGRPAARHAPGPASSAAAALPCCSSRRMRSAIGLSRSAGSSRMPRSSASRLNSSSRNRLASTAPVKRLNPIAEKAMITERMVVIAFLVSPVLESPNTISEPRRIWIKNDEEHCG